MHIVRRVGSTASVYFGDWRVALPYPQERNYGCRLTTDLVLKGYRALVLENQVLRIMVLVDKGTDIWEFLYKPLDIDFLWRSPMLLRDQRNFVSTSSGRFGFWYDHYAGGWQDILPSAGLPCEYKGADYGLHGESSTIPWEYRVLEDTPDRISVACWVRLYRSPFYVEKTLALRANSAVLEIEETVINEGREPMELMWGHHPAFGAGFLSERCVIDCSAKSVHAMPTVSFETQRFNPGAVFNWPIGEGRGHELIDVSRMPPPDHNTADMLYLSDLEKGWFTITDQDRGVGFGMTWPKEVFPYLWFWQVCGGAFGYPWYGRTYERFSTRMIY